MITASPIDDRTGLALSEASQLVRSKKVSPVELTHECLSRIERLNPKLNAFITVTADSAVAEGPHGGEATVLRLAYAYGQATEWHKRKPNLA